MEKLEPGTKTPESLLRRKVISTTAREFTTRLVLCGMCNQKDMTYIPPKLRSANRNRRPPDMLY
ncbi:UNVERIFIED_CONTAM: hypothetical protein NY603_25060, partial [Bacteroidetes bacterium 56_B9]